MMDVLLLARQARKASIKMTALDLKARNAALWEMGEALLKNREAIFAANRLDMAAAQRDQLPMPIMKRLLFDEKKLKDVLDGLKSLESLPDPLHQTLLARELSPGLDLYRVSCPIGVIGVVFESRPDALVQIASLALKSGNAALLKGGREALNTNRALFSALDGAAKSAGLPLGWAALLETREDVGEMLKADKDIDLIIPRGSNAFVKYIMENTSISVMGHAEGLCHTYVDDGADVDLAVRVVLDAKTQAYAVCNATETLLVHRAIAPEFLPEVAKALKAKGVTLRGDERTCSLINAEPATEQDWATEYLDAVLSIKIVDSIDEAIEHINRYGSRHTDAIITGDRARARLFVQSVDSADVFVNCSTRFSDGYRYGFGAEVGIATGKLHARGPVGLDGLCTYKYVLLGSGQTVGDAAEGKIKYTHRPLDGDCPI